MTPAARAGAAVTILERILAGEAAEAALTRWARASRYAGSGDRAAVRDLVYDALRRRRSRAALGGALTGRGLILGLCREEGLDPDSLFGAGPHAPEPLTEAERAAGRAPTPDEATDLPDWLLPALRASLGPRFEAVAAALRDRAPVWLRANRLKAAPSAALAALRAEGITAEPSAELPGALRITEGARRLNGSAAYRDGLVELQDLSPQLAVATLGPLDGLAALDFCAGGGGKTLALAAAGAARLVAHDANPARMSGLRDRAARAGATVEIVQPGRIAGRFDLVVADVPCSGSGSWRRDPEGRWRLTPAQLEALLATQAAILDEAAARLHPGGRLAYMTCSLLEAENAAQIDAFLSRRPDFRTEFTRLMTPLGESDGFYVAVLRQGSR
ncbi:RsmB/NOP family class I SAM-dependent RNA methyltransferase [Paracoccus sp. S-4012]|uniref:RsmB/NOP family class I SAM-dependent RNA methyltransferase n=1 Tax=Paracoccus sp. S-4012 TaxID=2665648 RepID=UPI001329A6B6|nr:RsmB/NOP family class I SAM-dependent RNA methyltransferase [Paracoccus sp. S-4012]